MITWVKRREWIREMLKAEKNPWKTWVHRRWRGRERTISGMMSLSGFEKWVGGRDAVGLEREEEEEEW